jgi:hypothetical protein
MHFALAIILCKMHIVPTQGDMVMTITLKSLTSADLTLNDYASIAADALAAINAINQAWRDSDMLEAFLTDKDSVALLAQCERDAPSLLHGGDGLPEEYTPINPLIAKMRSDFDLIENSTLRAG